MANKSKTTNKAAGKVDPQIQANYDAAGAGYNPSANVVAAQNMLGALTAPTYSNSYEGQLDNIYKQILNREQFNYNVNKDALYQQYKNNYITGGKQAMVDTLGQASALTGGYGSSYADVVAQQGYQRYLEDLNKAVPDLYAMAYQRYQGENQRLLNNYGITSDMYNTKYNEYRDQMSDYHNDRNFLQGMYEDERDFDYSRYAKDRAYNAQEYWNQREAEQVNSSTSSGGGSTPKTSTSKDKIKKDEVKVTAAERKRTAASGGAKNDDGSQLQVVMDDVRMIASQGVDAVEDYLLDEVDKGKMTIGDAAYILKTYYGRSL